MRHSMIALSVAFSLALAVPAGAADPDMVYPGDYFGRVDLPLPQAFSHLKQIIDDSDNFEPVKNFSQTNRYRVMSGPIGRLDLLVRKDGKQFVSLCTGWLIAADKILTNNHCIPGHGGTVLKASLLMNYLEEGGAAKTERFAVDTKAIETRQDYDYSVVHVDGNPGMKYGVIPLQARDPQPGEELFVIQHPAGKPKRLTRRNCRYGGAGERPGEIRHYCDTLGGSSGSPVFSDNDMAVIGLHFAGIKGEVNFAKRMTAVIQQSTILRQIAQSTAGRASEAGRPQAAPAKPAPEATAPRPSTPRPSAPAPIAPSGGWQPIN